jgi:hypothetical protein
VNLIAAGLGLEIGVLAGIEGEKVAGKLFGMGVGLEMMLGFLGVIDLGDLGGEVFAGIVGGNADGKTLDFGFSIDLGVGIGINAFRFGGEIGRDFGVNLTGWGSAIDFVGAILGGIGCLTSLTTGAGRAASIGLTKVISIGSSISMFGCHK